MRRPAWAPSALVLLAALAAFPASSASKDLPAGFRDQAVDPNSWVDHDGRPIAPPAEHDPPLWGHLFREAFIEPIARTFDIPDMILWGLGPFGVEKNPEAANVNAWDEVSNSTWFTNRNHVRAVSDAEIRAGSFGEKHPAPPYEIKSVKTKGFNPGFNIKDAAGNRWVVKLDHVGYPQISSGAGVVSGRLMHAAGYNISHDEAFTFTKEELTIDSDLVQGKEGPPFGPSDLERLLERGATNAAGRHTASASLFLPGKVVGPFSFRSRRKDDPNDRYTHTNRRELRGLYVLYSWINNWDVKDHQSLDTFITPEGDSLGHVGHHLLDVNASLGASAEGPKSVRYGYEQRIDFGWIGKRIATLGFIEEPWRRARQKTGIPSVGNFEAKEFRPDEWRPSQYVQPFRKMTLGDAYWGAKIVASFSDRQIAAAIDAAGYEDPRARAYLLPTLIERRNAIARYWFRRVAPLDYFEVRDGELHFHDLAVDLGLESPRSYEVDAHGEDGVRVVSERAESVTRVALARFGQKGSQLNLSVSIAGSSAKAVRLELIKRGSDWVITRVRHG